MQDKETQSRYSLQNEQNRHTETAKREERLKLMVGSADALQAEVDFLRGLVRDLTCAPKRLPVSLSDAFFAPGKLQVACKECGKPE